MVSFTRPLAGSLTWPLTRKVREDRGGGGVAPVSGAALMLASESQGLALDFTDSFFRDLSGHYGSARVKDTTTPANNYNSHPYGLLTYSSPSLKLLRGPTGSLRYGAHNLLLQSEAFEAWSSEQSTVASDVIASPDGTSTADNIIENTVVSAQHVRYQNISFTEGTYVLSCWFKSDGSSRRGYLRVREVVTSGTTFASAIFDLVNVTASAGTITDAGNGWYLCSLPVTVTTGTRAVIVGLADNSGNTFYTGDGSSGVYTWGAHLRRTPSDDTYLKTSSAARYELPYEWDANLDGEGNRPLLGIRVEEQRTNLCLWSNDLTNAAWTKSNVTAAKTATGPDGVTNSASTLTATAANGYVQQNITSASAQRVSSVYIKRRTGTGNVYLSQGQVTGSEIVTNGTFDTDTTGWSVVGPGTLSVESGRLRVTCDSTTQVIARQTVNTTAGKIYRLSATVYGTVETRAQANIAFVNDSGNISSTASHVRYFRASGSTQQVDLVAVGDNVGEFAEFDDVSIKEVSEIQLTVTSDWTRVNTDAATITNPALILRFATSGDAVDVALFQNEVGAFVTSPIETAGSTVTRAADVFGPPLTAFPWNGGVGTYEVDGVAETPTNNGTILTLAARSGETHIRTVKWVPSP